MTVAVQSVAAVPRLQRTWELTLALTIRSIKIRYRATLLGQVWWIAQPLALGFILWFALGKVLRVGVEDYPLFLMSGIFPFYWFQAAVGGSAGILVNYAGLIRKADFPRLVLPLSAVLTSALEFSLTLPVLLVFALASGKTPNPTWLAGLPVLLLVQFFLLLGLAPLLASLNVFFRDIEPAVQVILRLLFYGTPIIYPLDRVPDVVRPAIIANPMTSLIEGWRDLVMSNDFIGAELWPALVIAPAMLFLGLGVFRLTERHFADAL